MTTIIMMAQEKGFAQLSTRLHMAQLRGGFHLCPSAHTCSAPRKACLSQN